jgi:predicted ATPase
MITQVEIDGFKTFKNFKVELDPFQVIVGPNGSGKSNFFDALQLVSQFMIPGNNVYKAMQSTRGEAGELFTRYPDGSTSDTIRIAVEMLVDKKAAFSDGREIDLKFARFRYELEIRAEKNFDVLHPQYFATQHVKPIPIESDSWCKKYNISPNTNFPLHAATPHNYHSGVSPAPQGQVRETTVEYLPKEGEKDDIDQQRLKSLKDANDLHYMYLDVAIHELYSLSFYKLNPEALRKRSPINAPPYLAPDGGNLPTTLARIKAEDQMAFALISRGLPNPSTDPLSIDVEKYDATGEYGLRVRTTDKRIFTAQALSDTALRQVALSILRHDPQIHETICIEEPENGIQPRDLHELARFLHDTATDFADPERADEPLRQIIVTTHSPLFISEPKVIDHLLLTTMPTRIAPREKHPSLNVTRMEPVMTPETLKRITLDPNEDRASKYYTINMVNHYLDSDALQQASEQLEQARSDLHKK